MEKLLRVEGSAYRVGGGGKGRAITIADIPEDMTAKGMDGLRQDLVVSHQQSRHRFGIFLRHFGGALDICVEERDRTNGKL